MNFSTAIVAVPRRLNIAKDLAQQLQGKIILDLLKNGSWWGHKQALLSYNPHCAYHLVLEDDVKLCQDFVEGLDKICGLFPEDPVSLFNMEYYSNLNRYAEVHDIHFIGTNGATGQGQLWPIRALKEFITWCDANIPETILYEDTRLWMWLKRTKRSIYLATPNLVEHIMPLDSVLGFRGSKNRWSGDFLGPRSAAQIDWAYNLESAKKTKINHYDYSAFWKKQGFNT